MIREKIKVLLKVYKKNHLECSQALNINRQSFTNKLNTRGFKTEDLIRLAELTGTRLAFIDDQDKPVVVFDIDDLEKE